MLGNISSSSKISAYLNFVTIDGVRRYHHRFTPWYNLVCYDLLLNVHFIIIELNLYSIFA